MSDRARFEPRKCWLVKPSHKRFRERHWPALARGKRTRWRRRKLCGSAHAKKMADIITVTSRVAEARGWLPFVNLMDAHYMRVCDALAAHLRFGRR